ncbi:MAG: 3-hydroxyacyl-CoA dehydrogenase [Alphaproteobacteria bacterium]|nr:3-hydroxyacyl-CoA dehydrogenase [Alphaproteobacteria bacterium]
MPAIPADRTIGIVGAGAMGAGIAQVAATAGHRVRLYDVREGAVETAIENLGRTLETLVAKGKMGADKAELVKGRLEPAESPGDFDVCALVVEAIVEDVEAKRKLFAELEGIVADDCILATNTSSLSISAIARGLARPGRVAGFHFFNPAPVMALVEIVSGLTTDANAAETLFDTAAAWGKAPVHAASTPGFVVNRCARPFYAEALRLLTERATDAATIDAVMRDCGGFRMGPCELMDMIGHDVNFAVTRSVYEAYFNDPRYLPSVLQAEMVAAGRLGRKSGRGFFGYGKEADKPWPATEPVGTRPNQVVVEGDLDFLETMVARAQAAEIPVHRRPAGPRGPTLLVDGVALRLTDGRTATVRARETGEPSLVLHDLALDYAECTRIAIAVADLATGQASAVATGFFQACSIAVSLIDDVPGLVVMRTLAMLVNEALEAVQQGVVSADGVDLAMTKGVNYPKGPFAWGREIGLPTVKAVLDNLHFHYGEDRYRASPRLTRLVARER